MPLPTPQVHRLCVACDLEGYGPRGGDEHRRLQQVLADVLDTACAAALGAHAELAHHQPSGDGRLIIMPPAIDEAGVIRIFLAEFGHRLNIANGPIRSGCRARVRVAMHEGLVGDGANGFPGDAPVVVGRLCDGPEVRAALAESPADHVVVLSNRLFEESGRAAFGSGAARLFHRISVTGKNGMLDAWLHLPEPAGDGAGPSITGAQIVEPGGLIPD
jgi:hypothetical protein